MSSTDKAVSLVSECLLKGMVMTAQVCLNCSCPLMRQRKTKELICPVCEQEKGQNKNQPETEVENIDESVEIQDLDHSLRRSLYNSAGLKHKPQAENSATQKQRPDISYLLGKRMLQGWTLLDTLCLSKNCVGVPLVRNKDKTSLCVGCETSYILSGDYDEKVHGPIKSISQEPNRQIKDSSFEHTEAKRKTKISENTLETALTQPSKRSIKPKIHQPNNLNSLHQSISLTEKIILDKISQLNDKLMNSSNPSEIEKIASALVALQKLIESSAILKKRLY